MRKLKLLAFGLILSLSLSACGNAVQTSESGETQTVNSGVLSEEDSIEAEKSTAEESTEETPDSAETFEETSEETSEETQDSSSEETEELPEETVVVIEKKEHTIEDLPKVDQIRNILAVYADTNVTKDVFTRCDTRDMVYMICSYTTVFFYKVYTNDYGMWINYDEAGEEERKVIDTHFALADRGMVMKFNKKTVDWIAKKVFEDRVPEGPLTDDWGTYLVEAGDYYYFCGGDSGFFPPSVTFETIVSEGNVYTMDYSWCNEEFEESGRATAVFVWDESENWLLDSVAQK